MTETTGQRRGRWALAAFLGGMGVLHVVAPRPFEKLIPDWLPGSRTGWNIAATVAEFGSAALLARERTARLGGAAAFATFSTVYVANVQAVIDGGTPGAPGWFGSREAAVLRLPLQFPLLWWSARIALRDDAPPDQSD